MRYKIRVPVVRSVDLYPQTGFVDRAWLDDPACDALVKSGRRVVEAFTAAIAERGLVARAGEVRILVVPAPDGQATMTLDVHLDFQETFEWARLEVPASVAGIGAVERAELVLDVLAATMRELGAVRGWSDSEVSAAADEVRAAGLELAWAGPWKSSPSRRHEARGVYWLEDHGHGGCVLEVRERGTDEPQVWHSEVAPAFCTVDGFKRSAATLRWVDGAAQLVPMSGLLGQREGLLRLAPGGGTPGAHVRVADHPAGAGGRRPELVVTASRDVADDHEIRLIGGGPINHVPHDYLDVLYSLVDELRELALPWWSAADRTSLRIQYYIGERGTPSQVKVRRLPDRVTVAIHRSLDTFDHLDDRDGGRLAQDDVRDLVEGVTKRMSLAITPEVERFLRVDLAPDVDLGRHHGRSGRWPEEPAFDPVAMVNALPPEIREGYLALLAEQQRQIDEAADTADIAG